MGNCGLTSQIKRIMYLNLNIVGGIATYVKQGCRRQMVLAKSHGSWHLFQKLLPTAICLATKISKPLMGKWKLFLVGQADFAWKVWFMIQNSLLGKRAASDSGSCLGGGCDGPGLCSQNTATQQVNRQLPCCLESHMPGLGEVIKDVWAQVWHLTSSHNMHFQN